MLGNWDQCLGVFYGRRIYPEELQCIIATRRVSGSGYDCLKNVGVWNMGPYPMPCYDGLYASLPLHLVPVLNGSCLRWIKLNADLNADGHGKMVCWSGFCNIRMNFLLDLMSLRCETSCQRQPVVWQFGEMHTITLSNGLWWTNHCKAAEESRTSLFKRSSLCLV